MLRDWPQLRRLWPLLFILRWFFSLLTLCFLAHCSDWRAVPWEKRRTVREHHGSCTTLSVSETATGFINRLYPRGRAMPLGFGLCFSSRKTCDGAVAIAFCSILLATSTLLRPVPSPCWQFLAGQVWFSEGCSCRCPLVGRKQCHYACLSLIDILWIKVHDAWWFYWHTLKRASAKRLGSYGS